MLPLQINPMVRLAGVLFLFVGEGGYLVVFVRLFANTDIQLENTHPWAQWVCILAI